MSSLVPIAAIAVIISSTFAAVRPRIALMAVAFLTALGTFNLLELFGLDSLWGMQPGPSKIAFYLFLPGFIVTLLLRPRLQITPRAKAAMILVLILMLSLLPGVFFAFDQKIAFKAWTGIVRWALLWALAVLLLTFEDCKRIIKAWIVFVVCVDAVFILSLLVFGKELIAKSVIISIHDGRLEIIGQDPNYWATFTMLALTSLLVWRPWRSVILTGVLSLIMISGILVTGSRAALVTLMLLSLIAAFRTIRKKPQMVIGSLVMVSLGALLVYKFNVVNKLAPLYERGLEQRVEVYLWSLYNLPNTILVGLGPANMPLVYDQLAPPGFITSGKSSHNMYLEVLNAGGLIPLTLFILFLAHALKTTILYEKMWRMEETERRLVTAIRWGIIVVMLQGMFLDLAWTNWVWVLLALPYLRHTRRVSLKEAT